MKGLTLSSSYICKCTSRSVLGCDVLLNNYYARRKYASIVSTNEFSTFTVTNFWSGLLLLYNNMNSHERRSSQRLKQTDLVFNFKTGKIEKYCPFERHCAPFITTWNNHTWAVDGGRNNVPWQILNDIEVRYW